MKTMCLAKKAVQMPNKEEHGFLLFCGLGARKWQVQIECDSQSFKQAILNIYPRLRSAVGYNLWTLTRDKKTFERIPEKVNTPRRIRSYLGSHFTGCLIIVPISDILLMEEKREHLRQMDMKDIPGQTRMLQQDQDRLTRSLCMLCGKMEKMPGTGSFHKIGTEEIACSEGTVPIVKKLTEILGVNVEAHRKKFIASEEICKKCLRAMIDISQMEIKLKSAREDLINNFFTTTSRFNKQQQHQSSSSTPTAVCNDQVNGERNGNNFNDNVNLDQYSFQQGLLMPTLSRPLAFIDPRQSNYGATPDMYQLCSVAGFAAAAAANMKKHRRGPGSSSSEQMNYVRNPDYRSRPGSEYAVSEVGSSSYISVSPPPRFEMNGGGNSSESVSPRPFHQQSMASTMSFPSQASSNLLKSKAQYKDYHCPVEEGERVESPSVVAANGEKAAKDKTESQDFSIGNNNSNDVCEVNQNHEETSSLPPTNTTKSTGDLLPKPQLERDLSTACKHATEATTMSSGMSSGPSPPSSSPGISSDNASASNAADDAEEIRMPVKKRKRMNNGEEFNGAGCTSPPPTKSVMELTEKKKMKYGEEVRRDEGPGLSLQESTEGH